eukprot:6062821-Pyramimonas_sp.AAC.1
MKSRSSEDQEKSWPPQKMEGTGPFAVETRAHPELPPLGQNRVPRVGVPVCAHDPDLGDASETWLADQIYRATIE